ncbi:hypothetical protein [Nocardia xishanensis]|uniref:Uncharacterized protein n=1 Tax=Nocardia xishanensis TaxID=238964 RepID=A0ABW7WWG1_9NOCA
MPTSKPIRIPGDARNALGRFRRGGGSAGASAVEAGLVLLTHAPA